MTLPYFSSRRYATSRRFWSVRLLKSITRLEACENPQNGGFETWGLHTCEAWIRNLDGTVENQFDIQTVNLFWKPTTSHIHATTTHGESFIHDLDGRCKRCCCCCRCKSSGTTACHFSVGDRLRCWRYEPMITTRHPCVSSSLLLQHSAAPISAVAISKTCQRTMFTIA